MRSSSPSMHASLAISKGMLGASGHVGCKTAQGSAHARYHLVHLRAEDSCVGVCQRAAPPCTLCRVPVVEGAGRPVVRVDLRERCAHSRRWALPRFVLASAPASCHHCTLLQGCVLY
jgi:hypothetical protein